MTWGHYRKALNAKKVEKWKKWSRGSLQHRMWWISQYGGLFLYLCIGHGSTVITCMYLLMSVAVNSTLCPQIFTKSLRSLVPVCVKKLPYQSKISLPLVFENAVMTKGMYPHTNVGKFSHKSGSIYSLIWKVFILLFSFVPLLAFRICNSAYSN